MRGTGFAAVDEHWRPTQTRWQDPATVEVQRFGSRKDHNRPMQNVVERVLNLLIFLLESPRPVTADDIRYTVLGYGQESDDAFHRMFERDKDLLRRMGVPIELTPLDAWEVEFGYTIDPDEYAL